MAHSAAAGTTHHHSRSISRSADDGLEPVRRPVKSCKCATGRGPHSRAALWRTRRRLAQLITIRDLYLEVLTTDSNLFAAQLNLVSAQQGEALTLVQLYGALGGGWQS